MKAIKLKVLDNRQVNERYSHIIVDAAGMEKEVRPGQFFNILCGQEYPLLRRPLSIYQINKESGTLEFLFLVKGLGTQSLKQVSIGESIDVLGPLGIGFKLDESWDSILLLARGVGVATLTALAQEAAEKNIRIIAVLSAKSRNDLLAVRTLENYGAKVFSVTDEDGNSDVDQVRQRIEQIMLDYNIKAGYTCGSKRLAKLLKEITAEKKIYAEIALEEYMACGMGVCLACTCDLKDSKNLSHRVRVCKEGPVFPLDKVVLS